MVLAKDMLPDFSKGELKFGTVKKFSYNKSLKDELKAGLSSEQALQLYRIMLYNRDFEQMIIELRNGQFVPFDGYKFIGATHLSIGQEAVAIGANAAIAKSDYITSSHRGHGHGIAKGAFALYESSDAELKDFIAEVDFESDKQTLIDKAMDVHLYRTMAEFMGKEQGYCRGRGGGMHIADFNAGHLGANAIVGGSLGIAAGAGLSVMMQGKDNIVLCFHGDGSANNGIWHESLNLATMAQFKDKGVPVIFLVENNMYGMTGQGCGEITGIDYLARRGFAYDMEDGMHAEVVNGMDVLAVRDAVLRVAAICRERKGPVLLETITYRFRGHSLSDSQRYRSKDEVAAWQEQCPIARLEKDLIANGLLTIEQAATEHEQITENMREITRSAAKSADPDPVTIYEGLFSDSTSETVPAQVKTTDYNASVVRDRRDRNGLLSYRHAIIEAMTEEMIRDKRVLLYGEDVGEHGGAFGASNGLYETFGGMRVFNSPISESAIIGSAVGMAITGIRPIVELMYIDFILMAMDQVGNQAAKNKYMFGGKAVIPMVIRTATGGGKGYAGQHSQSLEAVPAHIPGLKIVAPATPYDAKGLLKTAIRDDNPVIFIEHQLLYNVKGQVPNEEYTIEFGKADVKRQGSDITVVTYSQMVHVAIEAAEKLAVDGVSVEIVDIRSIYPLDMDAILASVEKTGKALVLNQAPQTGCFGEHIAYEIQSKSFDYLDCPVQVVGALNVPPPMAATLESAHIPSAEKVSIEIKNMLSQ
ncbi:pyruvate dehydrogenase complex E1 component subunit beta [Planctomycetota bacterium]